VPRLSTCKESALSEATLAALAPVRQNGALAEVYLQFANSEPAIRAYLGMEAALQNGSLDDQELECIKLLVSELTQCEWQCPVRYHCAAGIVTIQATWNA